MSKRGFFYSVWHQAPTLFLLPFFPGGLPPDRDPLAGLGGQPVEFCPELHEEFRVKSADLPQTSARGGIEFALGQKSLQHLRAQAGSLVHCVF